MKEEKVDYLQELIRLADIADPVECPSVDDWRKAQTEIGFPFPTDLITIVSQLGNGAFGEQT